MNHHQSNPASRSLDLPLTNTQKIRIVIADDHPIFRDGLNRLLAMEDDLEVIAQAQDGQEAIQILRDHEPDILLLDLEMSGLGGIATLQYLQTCKNRTRVIVLTASDDNNEFVRAVKLGISALVLKQTATDVLVQTIRDVHAGEIRLDPELIVTILRQTEANDEVQAPVPVMTRSHERPVLSRREREAVALVAQGLRNKDISQKLFISEQTVKNHLHNIFDKLSVSDRLELALYAIQGMPGATPSKLQAALDSI